jgi:hypothetical protein
VSSRPKAICQEQPSSIVPTTPPHSPEQANWLDPQAFLLGFSCYELRRDDDAPLAWDWEE